MVFERSKKMKNEDGDVCRSLETKDTCENHEQNGSTAAPQHRDPRVVQEQHTHKCDNQKE
jgi:hypothetical protein